MKTEIKQEKIVPLQVIHFLLRYTTNLGIVGIVIVRVIKELGRNKDAGNEDAVYIQGGNAHHRLKLDETVNVGVCYNKAGGTTMCILEDPFQVLLDSNGGGAQAIESRELLVACMIW